MLRLISGASMAKLRSCLTKIQPHAFFCCIFAILGVRFADTREIINFACVSLDLQAEHKAILKGGNYRKLSAECFWFIFLYVIVLGPRHLGDDRSYCAPSLGSAHRFGGSAPSGG